MTSYYERQVGVTASDLTLPRLQRDGLIDSAVLGLHDFVDSFGYDGGTIGVSKAFPSYLRGGSNAVAGTALTYSDTAVQFDGGSSNRIVLPAAFLLNSSSQDLLVGVWMKSALGGHTANTTSEMVIGTHASGASQSFNMSIAADSSGNVNDFYHRWGTTTTVASTGNVINNIGSASARRICDNAWHQVVSRFIVSPDETAHKTLLYLDGVLIAESQWLGRDSGSVLRTVTEARLGVPTGGNRCFKGALRRAWCADVELGDRTADEIIDDDWQANKTRLRL